MARVVDWLPRAVIVTAAAGTITGLVLVERVGDRYEAALGITSDAADVLADASEPIASLPADVASVAGSVEDALVEVRDVVGTAGESIDGIAEALRTNLAESVSATADVADRAASVIETVERFIPGNVDSLAEELRAIADGLEPTTGQLVALADQLDAAVIDLAATSVALEDVERQLDLVADRLGEAAGAVEDLPAIAADLRAEARAAQDDLESDLWWMRLGIVLLGLTLALLGVSIEAVRTQLQERTGPRDDAGGDGAGGDGVTGAGGVSARGLSDPVVPGP